MALFDRIVSSGSLSAAGRSFGLSPGAVSQRLQGLERRYGTPLLVRSSRSIGLTQEGRIFLEAARNVLAETDALADTISDRSGRPAGRLRVSAPSDLGRQFVAPLVTAFAADHPGVCVELKISDGLDDIVAGDVDVAFRYGNLKDSALLTRVLAPNKRVVVAAPSYLRAHAAPLHPNDLSSHACLLLMRNEEKIDRWTFMQDGDAVAYAVSGSMATDDGDILRRWAIDGLGLAYKSLLDVRADLDEGRLVEVLADHAAPSVGAQVIFSKARQRTPRVRAFVDAAVRWFARTGRGF